MPEPMPVEYESPRDRQRWRPPSFIGTVAMVLGVCGLLSACVAPPVLGVLGIVIGIAALLATWENKQNRLNAKIGIVAVVLSIPISLWLFLPRVYDARQAANAIRCGSNLRQIGQAMRQYAINQPDAAYPADLTAVVASSPLTPDILVCPTGGTTPGAAPFALGVNTDYAYLAGGKTDAMGSERIAGYCAAGSHEGGTFVLFGDGSVRFELLESLPPEIAQAVQ